MEFLAEKYRLFGKSQLVARRYGWSVKPKDK